MDLKTPVSDLPIRPTHFAPCPLLSSRLGVTICLASETGQVTGSFKFRAAYNVSSTVPHRHVITASSGNYGQALAAACRLFGKSCTVVMPETSARVKIEAVRRHGGVIEFVDTLKQSRHARVAELAAQFPDAYVSSAYDDPLVIAGNASLGRELATFAEHFDCVLAPVGGGGLTSGIVTGLRNAGRSNLVYGVEPLIANDAARSLRAGRIIANESEPQTVADGVRTISLGKHNWAILQNGLAGVFEVSEEAILNAVRAIYQFTEIKVEPTAALPVAAIMERPEAFRDQRVCCVISGGNIDPECFDAIIGSV